MALTVVGFNPWKPCSSAVCIGQALEAGSLPTLQTSDTLADGVMVFCQQMNSGESDHRPFSCFNHKFTNTLALPCRTSCSSQTTAVAAARRRARRRSGKKFNCMKLVWSLFRSFFTCCEVSRSRPRELNLHPACRTLGGSASAAEETPKPATPAAITRWELDLSESSDESDGGGGGEGGASRPKKVSLKCKHRLGHRGP